jgi:hypothetical protein
MKQCKQVLFFYLTMTFGTAFLPDNDIWDSFQVTVHNYRET